MFMSNSNMDYQHQHQYQQPMFERPSYENDTNPNPKQDLHFSFLQFSPTSCLFDNEDAFFNDLQHHLQSVGSTPFEDGVTGTVAEKKTSSAVTDKEMVVSGDTPLSKLAPPVSKIMNKMKTSSASKIRSTNPRKRTGKKDRHSKILTAQGPRDRRMRLNVETAGKFFSVQDMLGVDKASKTVEWLLNMCEPAIKELTISFYKKINQISSSPKSTSSSTHSPECEVQSEIDQQMVVCEQDRRSSNLSKGKSLGSSPSTSTGKNKRIPRKITFHPLGRELRAKARERARERTMEKLMLSRRFNPLLQGNPNSEFRSLNVVPSEKSEDSGGSAGSHDLKSSLEVVNTADNDYKNYTQISPSPDTERHDQTATTDSIDTPADEQPIMITQKSNPTSMYSYLPGEIGLGSNGNSRTVVDFSEIWGITNNVDAGTSSSYSSTTNLDLLPLFMLGFLYIHVCMSVILDHQLFELLQVDNEFLPLYIPLAYN